MKKSLKKVKQCAKCPWKVATDPNDIPNGYCKTKHKNLSETIAKDLSFNTGALKVMACHETHDAHCIGWLNNQLNQGNNIALRLSMMNYDNANKIQLVGEQHETFLDTLK